MGQLRMDLPDPLERWRDLYLADVGQKLLVFLGAALLLYVLLRIARRLIGEHIEDVNRRHSLRKATGYAYVVLLVLTGAAIFAESLAGFGTVLGLVLAGIAVALQDVLKSVVGWVYLSTRAGVAVGSRVEVGGVMGDVIDVGVLKTTMLEVGNQVFGQQSTGRLVTIPNYQMLSSSVTISSSDNPLIWQEVRVAVTFESDWERAEAILREIGEAMHAEVEPDLQQGFSRMEERYAFKYGVLTPIVYVTLGSYGVHLTLRYLVAMRARRGSEDRVSRRVLAAFARAPGIEIAYPAYRVMRPGERWSAGDATDRYGEGEEPRDSAAWPPHPRD